MMVLLAAVGVLLAGAFLPLAFDDKDDDGGQTEDPPDPVEASDEGTRALLSPEDVVDLLPPADLPDETAPTADLDHEAPPVMGTDLWTMYDPEILVDDEEWASNGAEGFAQDQEGRTTQLAQSEGAPYLAGSEQADSIDVPHRALVLGMGGPDSFFLDGATPIGEQAELPDFDPDTDRLAVVWDDSGDAEPPDVTFGTIEDAAHLSQVIVDGVVIAHVNNADGVLGPQDVALVPRSSL